MTYLGSTTSILVAPIFRFNRKLIRTSIYSQHISLSREMFVTDVSLIGYCGGTRQKANKCAIDLHLVASAVWCGESL
jgi:hypothetical protein